MFTMEGLTPYAVTQLDGQGRRIVVRTGQASSAESLAAQRINDGEIVICGEVYEVGTILTDDGVIEPVKPVPVITIDQIKAEQARRLKYTDWAITRATDPTDGRPVPEAIIAERQRIRERATLLEAMVPIPPDYRDEKHWI